jgi:hypothetical protein
MKPQDKLARAIKNMHPVYASYLMQRIKQDTMELVEQIPAIYAKDREDMANGRISMFHPDFYVTYVNELIQVCNEVDDTDIPLVEYERESVFEDTTNATN